MPRFASFRWAVDPKRPPRAPASCVRAEGRHGVRLPSGPVDETHSTVRVCGNVPRAVEHGAQVVALVRPDYGFAIGSTVNAPFAGDAFEFPLSAVFEEEPG